MKPMFFFEIMKTLKTLGFTSGRGGVRAVIENNHIKPVDYAPLYNGVPSPRFNIWELYT
jgi:hypothetical protein